MLTTNHHARRGTAGALVFAFAIFSHLLPGCTQAQDAISLTTECSPVASNMFISGVVSNASAANALYIVIFANAGTGNTADDIFLYAQFLAAGESDTYSSFFFPTACAPLANIVTATATNLGFIVQAVSTNICESPAALEVTKSCQVVSNGTLVSVAGVVSNAGAVNLNFVTVVDDHGTPSSGDDTLVFGPSTLSVGGSVLFGDVYSAALTGSITNAFTATGYFGPGITNCPIVATDSALCFVPPGTTPPGTNVVIRFPDLGAAVSNVTLAFAEVSGAGQTSVTPTNSPVPPPALFGLGDPPVFIEVETTAVFSGLVEVCADYSGITFSNPANPQLFHFVSNIWVNVTSSVDPTNRVVCGIVESFSPFTIFQSLVNFSGFFPPVDNPPTVNTVRAGSAVPVRFSLGRDFGLDIFAADYPQSMKIDCDSGGPQDAIEQTTTAGSSSLTYDARTDRYTFVWKTSKSWAGTCRRLILRFGDGTERVADFKFTK